MHQEASTPTHTAHRLFRLVRAKLEASASVDSERVAQYAVMYIALILAAGAESSLLIKYLQESNMMMAGIEAAIILAVSASCLFGAVTRNPKAGLQIELFSVWVGLTVIMMVQGGLNSPNTIPVTMLGPIIYIFGLEALGSLISGLAFCSLFLTFYLASNGLLPKPVEVSNLYRLTGHVLNLVSLFGAGVIGSFWRKHIDKSLAKERAESAKLAKQKQQFLIHLNHELRNPLTAMLSASQAFGDGEDQEQRKRLINTISVTSNHIMSILNDVLELEKLTVSTAPLRNEDFSVVEILEDVTTMFQAKAKMSGGTIKFVISDGFRDRWIGPPVRIRQVLINLISNALKHAPGSDVTIAATSSNGVLQLDVMDNGPGIAEELKANLFVPYATSSEFLGSTGLGLHISKALVHDHMHGELTVNSTSGLGTTFTLKLPFPHGVAQPSPPSAVSEGESSLSVLLVDDNADTLSAMCTALECRGIKVAGCETPESALMLVRSTSYDVVLADLNYGFQSTMDGIALTKAILEIRPCGIIGFTGNVSPEVVSTWISEGAHSVLIKPCQPSKIIDTMKIARHRSS